MIYTPSESDTNLPEVVHLSRESGILLPATSYIVVENSAQWKMLELKEKQKLKNKKALEFTDTVETPEPSTWILIISVLFIFAWLRRQAKTHTTRT